jgi:hypothetical protein
VKTKTTTVLVTLLALSAAGAVIASAATAGWPRSGGSEPDPLACPKHYREPHFKDYPALDRTMIPHGTGQAVLCRYAGVNASDPHALVGSGIIPAHDADLRRVVRIYNALPPPPAGPTSCPADTGRAITMKIRHRDRGSDFIKQDVTGCRVGTNGHRSAWTWSKRGNRLLHLLRHLSGA